MTMKAYRKMTDIHSHIIPGVDDGASDLHESLEMLKLAESRGTGHIVCTPHLFHPAKSSPPDAVLSAFGKLRQAARDNVIGVKLSLGCELYLTESGAERVEAELKKGGIFTLNSSSYLLAELDVRVPEREALRLLDKLSSLGVAPVLAHPERYRFVIEDNSAMKRIREKGVLLQVNKDSLRGFFGRGSAEAAWYALSHRYAHVTASDAHSPYERNTSLRGVHELLCEELDPDYADVLLVHNPRLITENKRVCIP